MVERWQAWVQLEDGTMQEWNGLRKTQAQWRYHWIRRRTAWGDIYQNAKQWGWRVQWDG